VEQMHLYSGAVAPAACGWMGRDLFTFREAVLNSTRANQLTANHCDNPGGWRARRVILGVGWLWSLMVWRFWAPNTH
jgi:hypothetical protein